MNCSCGAPAVTTCDRCGDGICPGHWFSQDDEPRNACRNCVEGLRAFVDAWLTECRAVENERSAIADALGRQQLIRLLAERTTERVITVTYTKSVGNHEYRLCEFMAKELVTWETGGDAWYSSSHELVLGRDGHLYLAGDRQIRLSKSGITKPKLRPVDENRGVCGSLTIDALLRKEVIASKLVGPPVPRAPDGWKAHYRPHGKHRQ